MKKSKRARSRNGTFQTKIKLNDGSTSCSNWDRTPWSRFRWRPDLRADRDPRKGWTTPTSCAFDSPPGPSSTPGLTLTPTSGSPPETKSRTIEIEKNVTDTLAPLQALSTNIRAGWKWMTLPSARLFHTIGFSLLYWVWAGWQKSPAALQMKLTHFRSNHNWFICTRKRASLCIIKNGLLKG
jgi:hypothetical protein